MTQEKTVERPFVSIHQKKREFFVTSLPAADLAQISYFSVRGRTPKRALLARIESNAN